MRRSVIIIGMKKFETGRGSFARLGPEKKENAVSVSVASDKDKPLALELYSLDDRKRLCSIQYPKEYRIGSVFSMTVEGLDPDSCLYRLKSGRNEYIDPYVKSIKGNEKFGKRDGLGFQA